jgi:hypothetical protein
LSYFDLIDVQNTPRKRALNKAKRLARTYHRTNLEGSDCTGRPFTSQSCEVTALDSFLFLVVGIAIRHPPPSSIATSAAIPHLAAVVSETPVELEPLLTLAAA